jgi:ubiquitin C-terminal hydrolase
LDETNFKYTKYDLLANIIHEGKPDSGFYKCHVKHKVSIQIFIHEFYKKYSFFYKTGIKLMV